MRKSGSLSEGVKLEEGGTLKVLFSQSALPHITSLNLDLVDNEILLNALAIKNTGQPVKFISKDLNARVKADVLGLESEDYLKGHVPREEFYKGWVRLMVPSVQLKQEVPDDLIALSKNIHLCLMNMYWLNRNTTPIIIKFLDMLILKKCLKRLINRHYVGMWEHVIHSK
jgi:predicted ribonuclease YlaK